MPPATLERSAPSLFRQGPSPLLQLALYAALALFLMVADARFQLVGPLRQAVATVLYPAQWLMRQPVEFARQGLDYFESLHQAEAEARAARAQMLQLAQRAHQADLLLQENQQLRALLQLKPRIAVPSLAAEVIYEAADPFSRRVVIDRGQAAGVVAGAPVVDAAGVLGQVTRVLPLQSEVTLLIDREQATPVQNMRTGVRGIAFGDPTAGQGGGLELRFMPSSADIRAGDLLSTSGVDGVYPPGQPVARVLRVERRADSTFARVLCAPLAQVQGARHVLVLQPLAAAVPQRLPPAVSETPAAKKKGKGENKAEKKSEKKGGRAP